MLKLVICALEQIIPKFRGLEPTYLKVSVGQELGSDLSRLFWLSLSYKIAVMVSASHAVIQRLAWSWRIPSKMTRSHGWRVDTGC